MTNSNLATVNITYSGKNADLLQPVPFDGTDQDIKAWAKEAILSGSAPGIIVSSVDLADFMVERFSATDENPYNRIMIRAKTPFG